MKTIQKAGNVGQASSLSATAKERSPAPNALPSIVALPAFADRLEACPTLKSAFTLIELIGVLAVVAILAAFAVPSVIKEIDQAARTRDAAEVSGLASAL